MINKFLSIFGYKLLKKKKSINIEDHLAYILSQLNINLVFDVGANIGQFGLLLRKNGYKGTIISFEPCSDSFEKLKKASHNDDNWKIFKMALGDKKTQKEINIFNASDLNSFNEVSDLGKIRFDDNFKKIKTELIHLSTLNDFFEKNNLNEKRIFLKMDTQGYDLNVFRGANKFYSSILGLMAEIPVQKIYNTNENYHETIEEYESNDFRITGIFPVSHNKKNHTVIEFDCVMVKI